MDILVKRILAIITAIVTFYLFYLLVTASLNGILKFGLGIVLLGVCGTAFKKLLDLEGDYGLVLLRTTKGLELMDRLANAAPKLWLALIDLGYVLSFGAASKLLFKKISLKIYAVSLILLAFSSVFILPILLPIASSIITELPLNPGQMSRGTVSTGGESLIPLILFILIFLGGFLVATLAGLLLNSFSILSSIVSALLGDGSALANTVPGAAPILPGINIPFYEGLIALAILIVVHEGAHGILARVEKIKLTSSGVVLFGILPVGAFVDPDEEQLQKQKDLAQNNVLVAGSTANFITALFAFLLLSPFLFTNVFYDADKVVVIQNIGNSTLLPGEIIQKINNEQITSLEKFLEIRKNLKEGDEVVLLTNLKEVRTKLTKTGIGIYVNNPLKYSFLYFIYNILGLTFVLNFLIGSVNLLPIPMFDGNRIVSILVKNQFAMKAINYIIIISFLVNLLPWGWR